MAQSEGKIMNKVLIVCAHPDDAEIGMGGTIAKLVAEGLDVTIVDLTDGEPTPFGSKELRLEEAKRASEFLGVDKRIFLDMPNRYLEPSLENRRKLAEVIRSVKPGILFSHLVPDWHPDHIAAVNLTRAARFEAKYHKTGMAGSPHWAPGIYGFYSPHRFQYRNPSFIVDISDYWEQKWAAVQAYESQLHNAVLVNQPSYIEKVEVACRYFGQCIGVDYGEPFISSGPLGVRNPELLFGFAPGQ